MLCEFGAFSSPLSIHLHLVLFLPLFSLPFAVPPVGKDFERVELRHGARRLIISKMRPIQAQMGEPTNGDVVQELLVPPRNVLEIPSELR